MSLPFPTTDELYSTPIKYVVGLDGKCYAVFANEYWAESYMDEFGGVCIACCDGYMNAVLVTETIGM